VFCCGRASSPFQLQGALQRAHRPVRTITSGMAGLQKQCADAVEGDGDRVGGGLDGTRDPERGLRARHERCGADVLIANEVNVQYMRQGTKLISRLSIWRQEANTSHGQGVAITHSQHAFRLVPYCNSGIEYLRAKIALPFSLRRPSSGHSHKCESDFLDCMACCCGSERRRCWFGPGDCQWPDRWKDVDGLCHRLNEKTGTGCDLEAVLRWPPSLR
jgi:hypothetical protein